MEQQTPITGVGGIYAVLAEVSNRPRYAFLVLQLVAEAADGRGQAGPFIAQGGVPTLLREWLCSWRVPAWSRGITPATRPTTAIAAAGAMRSMW